MMIDAIQNAIEALKWVSHQGADSQAVAKEAIAGLEALLEAPPSAEVRLPKITEEIFDDYNGTGLFEYTTEGYNWTQLAVDFACLIKAPPSVEEGACARYIPAGDQFGCDVCGYSIENHAPPSAELSERELWLYKRGIQDNSNGMISDVSGLLHDAPPSAEMDVMKWNSMVVENALLKAELEQAYGRMEDLYDHLADRTPYHMTEWFKGDKAIRTAPPSTESKNES
jgi:hypothetical protein